MASGSMDRNIRMYTDGHQRDVRLWLRRINSFVADVRSMRKLWYFERTQGRRLGPALVARLSGHLFSFGRHDARKLGS